MLISLHEELHGSLGVSIAAEAVNNCEILFIDLRLFGPYLMVSTWQVKTTKIG